MKALSQAAREARSKRKKYVKFQEGAELYSMGKSKFIEMAHDCGAVIKVGRSAFVDLEIFDRYFQTFRL